MSVERKQRLVDELLQLVETDYELAAASQRSTQEGATHEEARPENDKDTRALESSYLARGQAARVLELQDELAALRGLRLREFAEDSPAALGAVLEVSEDGFDDAKVYLLAPGGAGHRLEEQQVSVLTPRSPLGRALLGKRSGEEVELNSPRGLRTLVIERIC